MGLSMKESFRITTSQARANFIGQTEAIIQEKFQQGKEMALVSFPVLQTIQATQGFGKMDLNKVEEHLPFQMEQSMKVNSKKVLGTEQAK